VEARRIVRSKKFNSWKAYKDWVRKEKVSDLPTHPEVVYKNDGWVDIFDWLGKNENLKPKNKFFLSFLEARLVVRLKGFQRLNDYQEWKERPHNIPSNPSRTYKDDGWINWEDWLGFKNKPGREAGKSFRPFESARNFVRLQKFKSVKAYINWSQTSDRPTNIPSNPQKTYIEKGWVDWGDWLGTEIVATKSKKFKSFELARKFAQSLNLESSNDYRNWKKSNPAETGLPYKPDRTYKNKGWVDWYDWLGKPRPGEDPDSSS